MTLTNPDPVTSVFEEAILRIRFRDDFKIAVAHMNTYQRGIEYWDAIRTKILEVSGGGTVVVLINPSSNASVDFAHTHNVLLWRSGADDLEAHLRDAYALFVTS